MPTPTLADIKFQEGDALYQQHRLAEAIACYDQTLALDSGHMMALYMRGAALFQLRHLDAAADSLHAALRLAPDYAPAHNILGVVLSGLGHSEAALESYNTAIRLKPIFASPYINRSLILRHQGRFEESLASLDRALALAPNNPNAHSNRGSLLTEMNQPAAAIPSLTRALQINPAMPFLPGIRVLNKMFLCDWSNFDAELADLSARIARGEPAAPTWSLVGLLDSADLQRKAAEIWTAMECPENPALGPLPAHPRPKDISQGRIRLGYYSADFHRHATAYLIAELFECHDRSKFEVIAFSFGPQNGDDMQKRIIAACDRYVDVTTRTDREVAALSREMEIDIAVDLKGLSGGHRLGIFAHRAAPIQVAYLGYPCTLGAPYIDYLIADNTIIPDASRHFYTEKIVNLPNSYQVNDRKRKVGDQVFTRTELGLPDSGFVFCCFNNHYKITPATFNAWMRILKAVEGSVLWLLSEDPAAAANLRREAQTRGVDPSRLVFAGRTQPEEHLARHQVADLFLDTLPYNAHTTASDALWVGLPVLTCPGETFPSRVAASLLTALDMPEMIAPAMAAYEALAVQLAKEPERLAAVRQKLARNRATSPLFDTDLFTRNIEAAYIEMRG